MAKKAISTVIVISAVLFKGNNFEKRPNAINMKAAARMYRVLFDIFEICFK
jgi:hypothetical protein